MPASLLFGLAACQGTPAEETQPPPQFKALQWLDDAADPVAHMAQQPASCLAAPDDPAVQRGALLFESPMLLGGQAAKAGLSCAACHRNGRGNPDFVFAGISGAPGTADVTHGLFSKLRADQVFNPVPIPDLATAEGQTRVDRGAIGELEKFLSAQIVEEFSGSAPEPSVIADLAAYIRALDAAVCDPVKNEPQSWVREVTLIRAGLGLHAGMSRDYINAMRAALGRLHERFPHPQHSDLRTRLVAFSRTLEAGGTVSERNTALSEIETLLADAEADSFYRPEMLEAVWP